MRIWDSFFAFVVLFAVTFVPLLVVFHDTFHDAKDPVVDFRGLSVFMEILWLFAFFINLNRVDPPKRIYRVTQTIYEYLRGGFLVPDALVLMLDVIFMAIGKWHWVYLT